MKPQELYFELIRQSSFNSFDGEQVADDLLSQPTLWQGVVLWTHGEPGPLLRDLAEGHNNLDTLFIRTTVDKVAELVELAHGWHYDELSRLGGMSWLGQGGSGSDRFIVLAFWWD